ncbi:DMT family transporter [Marinobacterium sediminicola]|uniref:Transporter family-2 protein n=1 Tax=Marinobacterium sediminicola TaxID=518898 RepID=A0ABY1RWC4_9GAMM|nr:DMT family transporter [Marinobacterium sediminicola]ULG70362.1 DMT family transporter [Marinobacterium sediminicola]SMR69611.1 transporter family-2 protein [Marinobacterium sediminicola]
MLYFWLALAFVAGMMMPMQAGVNSTLALHSNGALWASWISFAVGTAALFGVVLAMRYNWPIATELRQAPWWAWTGGFMGALFVATGAFLAPRIGAATMVALLVAGQLIMSVILDHIGWATFPQHEINLGRILGVLCLIAGVVLIRMY